MLRFHQVIALGSVVWEFVVLLCLRYLQIFNVDLGLICFKNYLYLFSFSSNIWYFQNVGCSLHCSLDNWRMQIVEDIIMLFLGTHGLEQSNIQYCQLRNSAAAPPLYPLFDNILY